MPTLSAICQKALPAALMAVCSAMPIAASAQTDEARIHELEQKLERSLQLIDALGTRVKELEAHAAQPAEAQASAVAVPAPAAIETLERRVSELSASANASKPQQLLHGFADVGFGSTGKGGHKGFQTGTMDFYLTPHLGEHVKALAELVFEFDEAGDLGTDLERLQIGYSFNDSANIWLGRFHTPLGQYNATYHHGQQIQTALQRPRFIGFEDQGGIIPTHTVGLWGTGSVPAHGGRLSYDLYLGNNPLLRDGQLKPDNSGSSRAGASFGGNAGYQFGGSLSGLKIGVHGYRSQVVDDALKLPVSRINIVGAYAVLDSEQWDMISEYYHFNNQDQSGARASHDSWAAFAQLGRHFGLFTPYLRLEKSSLEQGDAYFAAQTLARSYTREALGARYELTPTSAIKLEGNHTHALSEAYERVNYEEVRLQWAIRF